MTLEYDQLDPRHLPSANFCINPLWAACRCHQRRSKIKFVHICEPLWTTCLCHRRRSKINFFHLWEPSERMSCVTGRQMTSSWQHVPTRSLLHAWRNRRRYKWHDTKKRDYLWYEVFNCIIPTPWMVHDIASTRIVEKLWKTKMAWLSNAAASSGEFLWKGSVGTPAPLREATRGYQKNLLDQ